AYPRSRIDASNASTPFPSGGASPVSGKDSSPSRLSMMPPFGPNRPEGGIPNYAELRNRPRARAPRLPALGSSAPGVAQHNRRVGILPLMRSSAQAQKSLRFALRTWDPGGRTLLHAARIGEARGGRAGGVPRRGHSPGHRNAGHRH